MKGFISIKSLIGTIQFALMISCCNFRFTDICQQFIFICIFSSRFVQPRGNFPYSTRYVFVRFAADLECPVLLKVMSSKWNINVLVHHRRQHVGFVYEGNLEARIATEKNTTINKNKT